MHDQDVANERKVLRILAGVDYSLRMFPRRVALSVFSLFCISVSGRNWQLRAGD
jgi:hypothetical protein